MEIEGRHATRKPFRKFNKICNVWRRTVRSVPSRNYRKLMKLAPPNWMTTCRMAGILASPAIRFGHEIAFKIQRTRPNPPPRTWNPRPRQNAPHRQTRKTRKTLEILCRKPRTRTNFLLERVERISFELSKHPFTIHFNWKLRNFEKFGGQTIRFALTRNNKTKMKNLLYLEKWDELIRAQLEIQTERLMKLKNQLMTKK